MKSSKWSMAAALSVAIFLAFASSALASGSYGLEQSGKPVPVGALLRLNNLEDLSLTNSKYGKITCAENAVGINVPVRGNEARQFPYFRLDQGSGSGSCKAPSGASLRVENIQLRNLETTSTDAHSAIMKLELDLNYNGIVCHLSSSEAHLEIGSQFGIHNILTMYYQKFNVTPSGACGLTYTLSGSFRVERPGYSQPVLVF